MARGWTKAKRVTAARAESLGHKFGNFRKNGRRNGLTLHTALCDNCRSRITVVRKDGKWLSDLTATPCMEIRRVKLARKVRRRR